MKYIALFSILTSLLSCMSTKDSGNNTVAFEEELRTNSFLEGSEIQLIETVGELTRMYTELQDPDLPRSAPIPLFDQETESMILLKPELKTLPYGDIEITGVYETGSTLTVRYKEVPNWEYEEKKLNNPVIILRVNHKPKKLKAINVQ